MKNLVASSSPGIKIYPRDNLMSPSTDHVTSRERERTLTISLNNHQRIGRREGGAARSTHALVIAK